MATYTEFYLKSSSRLYQYELIDISHPNFSKTYRIVRNKPGGLTVVIGGISRAYSYYPLKISSRGTRADLDFALQISLGDLGDIVGPEIDRVAAFDGFLTRPSLVYRTYRSDDLSAPIFGPITLEITELPMTPEGTTFLAQAPSLNNNRTGELYLPDRFPMLDGLL